MKKFIIYLFKVFPWIYMIVGVVCVIMNPPRNQFNDENAVLAIGMMICIVISSLMIFGLSYVVEAACKYLDASEQK